MWSRWPLGLVENTTEPNQAYRRTIFRILAFLAQFAIKLVENQSSKTTILEGRQEVHQAEFHSLAIKINKRRNRYGLMNGT